MGICSKLKKKLVSLSRSWRTHKQQYIVEDVPSRIVTSQFGWESSKFVGLDDELGKLRDWVMGPSDRLKVIAMAGMIGIGKTTLVQKVYNDPSIQSAFQHCLWVTVGPNCDLRKLLLFIVGRIQGDENHKELDDFEPLHKLNHEEIEQRFSNFYLIRGI